MTTRESDAMSNWRRRREQIELDPELPAGARILGQHLVDAAGERGCCWPSNGDLASTLGMSARAVRLHLERLERRRHVARRHLRQGDTLPGTNDVVERRNGVRLIVLLSDRNVASRLPGQPCHLNLPPQRGNKVASESPCNPPESRELATPPASPCHRKGEDAPREGDPSLLTPPPNREALGSPPEDHSTVTATPAQSQETETPIVEVEALGGDRDAILAELAAHGWRDLGEIEHHIGRGPLAEVATAEIADLLRGVLHGQREAERIRALYYPDWRPPTEEVHA